MSRIPIDITRKVKVIDLALTPQTIAASAYYQTAPIALGENGADKLSVTVKGMTQNYDLLVVVVPTSTANVSLTGGVVSTGAAALTAGNYRPHTVPDGATGSFGLPNKYTVVRVVNKGAVDATLENILLSYI